MRYDPYWLGWAYDANLILRLTFINIDTYVMLVKIVAAAVLYIIAIVYMIFQVM